ncbi:hypothetical protein Tco_0617287 [Tanacetum coccineum]
MAALKFADTHNMVVFLEKPTESAEFEEIVDFLNAHSIRIGKGFSSKVTQLFPSMVVQNQSQMGKGSAIPTNPQHTPTFIPSTSQPQKTQKPRKHKRQDTEIPQSSGPTEHVADEAVYKERDDRLVRAATTASSLEAEQDNGKIDKTQSKATLNEPSSIVWYILYHNTGLILGSG